MNDLITIDKMKQDEEKFIKDLIESKGNNLPATVGDVLQVFEFTDWKAKAWKTLADKMSKLEDQTEAYHSALRSGQQWGVAALYAQKRMGEITREMPKLQGLNRINRVGKDAAEPKQAALKKQGIGSSYKDAERIASHPEILERVIESSKESGDIPTKGAVLREIKAERAQKMKHEASQDAAIYNEKVTEQKVKERPKIVADYFQSIKEHREMAEIALSAAKQGLFSNESINIIKKKHQELNTLYAQIESYIGGNNE